MTPVPTALDVPSAERFARIALASAAREYPNHLQHLLNDDADVRAPRALHPAFYGSYDWHSAVHNHWLLVRLLRLMPQGEFREPTCVLLDAHLDGASVAAECRYLGAPLRAGFERPYGLAWLLQLAGELHEWNTAQARHWRAALRPLEELAVARFSEWLPKLSHAIRSGEHANTAFALGLLSDYARSTQHAALATLVKTRSRDFYSADSNVPLAYEPSGHDFLSPALAEADLMRRVLPQTEFAGWLDKFMPQIPVRGESSWLQPVTSRDRADGKLAHLDGLALSRAWMLDGVRSALSADDPRRAALRAAAHAHASAGLAAVSEEHYAGSHWLPSFAVYLATRRGIHEHG
ncbi:MAG TPA: DUF2891 domain-containing protein [Gammaproteobacteria bacterium]|nr:DUF2891 domain-containing protein [Gammaproteobacteria bacterium]